MNKKREAISTAAIIGLVAGMRSMMAPALVSRFLDGRRKKEDAFPMRLLGHPWAPTITAMMAAGELIGDKLPMTPPRIEAPSLFGRAASGALCGAAIGIRHKTSVGATTLVGGAAAVASTYAMYHLRRAMGERLNIPDVAVAVGEDALAISLGRSALE